MRSEYIPRGELVHVLASLMPQNRLALEVSMATGLRIDDVLSLKTDKLSQRMTVKEKKTGKSRRVYIPVDLLDRLHKQSGICYVFEGRSTSKKHRTRQAVFKDLKRSADLFRIPQHISPHTARKVYAVDAFHASGGNLKKVQELLQHSSEAVTVLYAMSDVLNTRKGAVRGTSGSRK